jgi:twinfilin-like protein
MTNAALIEIGDSVVQTLVSFKNDPSKRAVKLTLDGESLVATNVIPAGPSYKADFDGLQDQLDPREPSFIITRVEKTAAHSEYVLVVFIPPGCPVRPRTIFASGRIPVQRRLAQIFTGLADYFIDDIRELSYDQFLTVSRRDESALSAEEILLKREASDSSVAVVELPQHDSFTWPVDEALRALLVQFAAGGGPSVIAGMASPTGGAISLAGQGSSLSQIDGSQPRYIAIRYNTRGVEQKFFLLYCPDTAHPRQKMMSSTCKQSFLKACGEIGLAFDKTFEIRDAPDFSDDHFDELVNPPDVDHGYGEIKVTRKPRGPGRK